MGTKFTSNLKRFAGAAALTLTLSLTAVPLHAQYGPPPGQGDRDRDRDRDGWDAPPPEMQEAMRQGYQDGVVGARKDVENHRRPNVNNRDEFRHPNVPHEVRRDYREGFRRGYDNAMQHIYYGGGPRPY